VLPIIIAFGFAHAGQAGNTALIAGLLIGLPLLRNALVALSREAASGPARTGRGPSSGVALGAAIAKPTVWIMAGSIFLVSIIATGIVPHFMSIARNQGFRLAKATTIASVFGLATLGGRLFVSWLFDRFFALRVAAVIFLAAAAGYTLAVASVSFALGWQAMVAAAVLMGLGFGAESDLISYLASRYFGFQHFGAIYGTLLSIFILGVAAWPLLNGLLRDATGGDQFILALATALGLVAGLLMLLLPQFAEAACSAESGSAPSQSPVMVPPAIPREPVTGLSSEGQGFRLSVVPEHMNGRGNAGFLPRIGQCAHRDGARLSTLSGTLRRGGSWCRGPTRPRSTRL